MRQDQDTGTIHPTALVDPGAEIGSGVTIGPYTIIHGKVQIGPGSVIGAYCELGHPAHDPAQGGLLSLGSNTHIRSHSVFYEGSVFGDGLMTGHRVTVREQTRAGRNLQLGTLADIQGDCIFGDFVRLHSNVHVSKLARIGDYVWLFPSVVLTNDPHPPSDLHVGVMVEDYAAIAAKSVILPGVTVGAGALVGAHSTVCRDVAPDSVVVGSPARYVCETREIRLRDGSGAPAYPWRRHFHRGYLPEDVARWLAEFS